MKLWLDLNLPTFLTTSIQMQKIIKSFDGTRVTM